MNNANQILEAKKKNFAADTIEPEKQIDVMVYHLYELAKVIDGALKEEEFERYKVQSK